MTEPTHTPTGLVRLAKRLAQQLGCSRSMAEQYIEGGLVSVDFCSSCDGSTLRNV